MTPSPNPRGEDYGDYSPFVRLLETEGRVRILDVFIRKHYDELTAGDISELAGVSESTFGRNKDVLLELDIIEPVDNQGDGAVSYELNVENEVVQLLGEFHTELIAYATQISEATSHPRDRLTERAVERSLTQESNNEESEEVGEALDRDKLLGAA